MSGTHNLSKNLIHINQNAWIKMNKIFKKTDYKNMGFLFSAHSGGCNGFSYNLTLLTRKEYMELYTNNKFLNYVKKDDLKVYVEPLSEMYLLGTTIDYINEDYSKNIYESKFTFTPEKNRASTCGCGVSFSPKF